MAPSRVVAHEVKQLLHAVVVSESEHLERFSVHSEKQFEYTSSANKCEVERRTSTRKTVADSGQIMETGKEETRKG
jgi:hypothetical protein